ncbi:cell division protein [Bifidobacterium sp. ESL0690]|uniref:cell division protein n=1 Tax=Bifidobacterium sp. ESL0690 TaxID=2983214 RepID=UPI0023F894AE|nr:cell division protein [Bifidobacterium sp. ESL0690]WEV46470.1 cell division protein [Bifidobacterium sp. ESL0690]
MAEDKNLSDEEDDTVSKVIPVDNLSSNHNNHNEEDGDQEASGASSASVDVGDETVEASENTTDETNENDDSSSPKTAKPLFVSPSELPDLREHHDDTSADDDDIDDSADTDAADDAESKSRDEFTTVYDIIDQMSASIEETKSSIFAPGMVRLDRDEFLDQLGQLKAMLPVQLERASSLMREAERRLQNAQSQAQAIVTKAQSQAAQIKQNAEEQAQILAGQERVVDIAQQKARVILDDAQAKSTKLVQGANAYCADVMKALKDQVTTYDRDIRNGIDVIDKRQHEAAAQLEATQADALAHAQTSAQKTE